MKSVTKPNEKEPKLENDSTSDFACAPIAYTEFMHNWNKKNGFACQVCKFEERGMRLGSVLICTNHCLRLCTRRYDRETIF